MSDPGPPRPAATSTATTRYGTARAAAWARLHQQLAARAGWEGHDGELPVIEGTLIRLHVEHLPGDRSSGAAVAVVLPRRRRRRPRWTVPGRRSCAASISNTHSGS